MVLSDITNTDTSSLGRKLGDVKAAREPPASLVANLHSRALEQENQLLRQEVEQLRAQNAALVSSTEPRTPRRTPTPGTPRAAKSPRTPQTPKVAARTPARSAPSTPRTPRSRQEAQSEAVTPRRAPTRRPFEPKVQQPPPATASGNNSKAASGTRAAWANALWEQQRRAEAAHEAMAELRRALSGRRQRHEQVLFRSAGLSQELKEATAGHPERLQSLGESATAAADGLEEAKVALAEEDQQTHDLRVVVTRSQEALAKLEGKLANLEAACGTASADRGALRRREENLRCVLANNRADFQRRTSLLAECGDLLRRMNNEILSLKGNVRVFCRWRPALAGQEEASETLPVEFREDLQGITVYGTPQLNVTGLSEQTRSWDFEFDHVFRPAASQGEVFEEVALLVQSALDGYRVAILAYGQTGSGKTFTMTGSGTASEEATEKSGMIPRTVDLIFKEVEQLKKHGWEFEVSAGMAEVYNDSVLDLTAAARPSSGPPSPGEGDRSFDQPSCRRIPVRDAAAVYSLLRRARRERHVAATAANERSSRSHAVVQLALAGRCTVPGQQREVSGLLSFVDLAGSERLERSGAVGDRLKEAQHINRSLCALGDVIEAICRKGALKGPAAAAVHVPYRNSRLTMLLRDSLGGDSKTLMFVNVSPLQEHLGETLSSLRFASKVHACSVGVAKRHVSEIAEARS